MWADGIHANVRLEDDANSRQCLLVLMGATAEGQKELIAVIDGYRESKQSWMELLLDLKQRGLLDETLILCTGEFGRTPSVEMGQDGTGASQGRDHNHWGFSLWMAGGGIKQGFCLGSSDEDGFMPKDNPVKICDLHATFCHLLGIDPNKEVMTQLQRPMKLVDNGSLVKELIG